MQNKYNSFKKNMSELEKSNTTKELKEEELKDDDEMMKKIGNNAKIALKIMLDGEER